MADGMSFLFQIDSNTPGLDDLLRNLDKTTSLLGKGHEGLKALDTGMKHAGEGAKGLSGAFENALHKGLEPFLEKAKNIAEFEFIREGAEKLLEFPGEVAEKLKELGEDVLEAAAHEERLGRAFENALGPDVGRETLEYFDAIADKTEFTHGQIKGMGLELAKSGFQGENLKNAVAAAADLASMTDNPVMGGQEAVDALKRIMTTGRIEGRALVPFGIQKGEFEKELATETGLGIKGAEKALEAGKIPIETTLNSLFKTITEKTGKDLGGAGTSMADTFGARLAHLKEKPDLIFEGMKDTQGFKDISDFLDKAGQALDPKSPLGKILSQDLAGALDTVGAAVKGIDLDKILPEAASFMNEVVNDMPAAIAMFKELAGAIGTGVEWLGKANDLLHDFTILGPIEDMISAKVIKDAGLVEAPLGERMPKNFDPEQARAILHSRHLAQQAGAMDAKGYAGGLESATPAATTAMSTLADKTVDALKDAHQQHSPSALFRRIGELDVAGYTEGVKGGTDDVEDAMESTFAPAVNAGADAGAGAPTLSIESIVVNVEGHGADGFEHGRLIARGMEDELQVMFLRFLEMIAKRKGR